MRRWAAIAGAAALAAGAVGMAGPAAAQQPGRNGEATYLWENMIYAGDKCLTALGDGGPYSLDAGGGIAWARGGKTAAVVGYNADQTTGSAFVVPVSPCGQPRAVGPADIGSTPSWSPDGTRLAVVRGGHVVLVDVARAAAVADLGAGSDPSWSPNGKTIAYVRAGAIRTRPAAGGTERTFKTGASAPDYSPDGSKIAYLAGGVIKTSSASSGGSTKSSGIRATDFAYSPDGGSFLFISSVNEQVIIARTTGRITARVNTDPDEHTHPAWQPVS